MHKTRPTKPFIHNSIAVVTLILSFAFFPSGSLYCLEKETSISETGENNLILPHKTISLSLPSDYGVLKVEIHFPPQKFRMARRVAEVVKDDFIRIVNYFKSVPQTPVHFGFDLWAKTANGGATVFPQNLIILNDYPPLGKEHLNGTVDWVRSLVIHEFIHILHMDRTEGVLDVFRHVFGSTAKLGGVAPRWFVEGLATWGESHFANEGRIKQLDIDQHLLSGFFKQQSCADISCLDDPGHFPFRGYPYWVGSRFLHFVEQKKPGALACIVADNSSNLPFFLNWPFKNCTGQKAQALFNQFRQQFLKKSSGKKSLTKTPPKLKAKAKNSWTINREKGFGITGNYLLFVEGNKLERDERLVSLNLSTQKRTVHEFERAFDGIQVDPHAPNQVYLKILVSGDEIDNRRNYIFDLNKESIPEELQLKGLYFFRQFPGGPLHRLQYDNGVWKFDGKEIEHFYLSSPREVHWQGRSGIGYLTLNKSINGSPLHVLKFLDFKAKELEVIYASDEPLRFFGECKGEMLVEKKNLEKGFLQIAKGNIKHLDIDRQSLVDMVVDGNQLVVLGQSKQEAELEAYDCDKFLAGVPILDESGQDDKRPLVYKYTPDKKMNEESLKSYPKLKHFRPYHWMASYSDSSGLGAVSASTSFQDPLMNNVIDANAVYYPNIGKMGGAYGVQSLFNRFTLGGKYFKQYFRNEGQESNDHGEGVIAFMGNSTIKNVYDFNHARMIYVHKEKLDDFVSARKFIRYGMLNSFTFFKTNRGRFFQGLHLATELFYQDTRRHKPFWGTTVAMDLAFDFGYRNRAKLKGSYGRLFKPELESGSLFGGGAFVDIFSGANNHELYGVEYGDLFGNYIVTSGLEYEADVYNLYKGWGFWPLFLKELKAVAGVNYAYADRTRFETVTELRQHHVSVYAGAGMGTNLGYLLPVRVDLVLAKVITSPSQELRPLVLVKTSY